MSQIPAKPNSGWRLRTSHAIARRLAAHGFRGAGRLRLALARAIVPAVKGPVLVHTAYGFDVVVDPVGGRGLESEIYYCGTYEPGTLAFFAGVLRPGDTVLDIGANIGFITLFSAARVGPGGAVHAFEPQPATAGLLRQNIQRNGFTHVQAHETALGSVESRATLHDRPDVNRGSATLLASPADTARSTEVPITTLDAWASSRGLAGVRLVKIDVEGWELEVLKGAVRFLSAADAPMVCVECSGLHGLEGGQPADLFRLLAVDCGYRVFRLARGKDYVSVLVPVPDDRALPQHDNLFAVRPEQLATLPGTLFLHGNH